MREPVLDARAPPCAGTLIDARANSATRTYGEARALIFVRTRRDARALIPVRTHPEARAPAFVRTQHGARALIEDENPSNRASRHFRREPYERREPSDKPRARTRTLYPARAWRFARTPLPARALLGTGTRSRERASSIARTPHEARSPYSSREPV